MVRRTFETIARTGGILDCITCSIAADIVISTIAPAGIIVGQVVCERIQSNLLVSVLEGLDCPQIPGAVGIEVADFSNVEGQLVVKSHLVVGEIDGGIINVMKMSPVCLPGADQMIRRPGSIFHHLGINNQQACHIGGIFEELSILSRALETYVFPRSFVNTYIFKVIYVHQVIYRFSLPFHTENSRLTGNAKTFNFRLQSVGQIAKCRMLHRNCIIPIANLIERPGDIEQIQCHVAFFLIHRLNKLTLIPRIILFVVLRNRRTTAHQRRSANQPKNIYVIILHHIYYNCDNSKLLRLASVVIEINKPACGLCPITRSNMVSLRFVYSNDRLPESCLNLRNCLNSEIVGSAEPA